MLTLFYGCQPYLPRGSSGGQRRPPPTSPPHGVVVVVISRMSLIVLITRSLIMLIIRSSINPLSSILSSALALSSSDEGTGELSATPISRKHKNSSLLIS